MARNGTFWIASGVSVSTTVTLSGVFANTNPDGSSNVSAACKNITVTPPETSWEKQDLLGKDSNNFQNQLLDEKPVGIATVTATLVLGEDETVEDRIISGTTTAPAGYTRRQVGNVPDTVVNACVALNSADYGNMATFALFNGKMTKWGDIRISGPDSHWEQDITVICLAKDFYQEFKD